MNKAVILRYCKCRNGLTTVAGKMARTWTWRNVAIHAVPYLAPRPHLTLAEPDNFSVDVHLRRHFFFFLFLATVQFRIFFSPLLGVTLCLGWMWRFRCRTILSTALWLSAERRYVLRNAGKWRLRYTVSYPIGWYSSSTHDRPKIYWRLFKPIFLKTFSGVGQGWRTFLRARAQIVDSSWWKFVACGNLNLLAPYFRLFQRRLGARYRFEPRTVRGFSAPSCLTEDAEDIGISETGSKKWL
jgi:hypothetical protein